MDTCPDGLPRTIGRCAVFAPLTNSCLVPETYPRGLRGKRQPCISSAVEGLCNKPAAPTTCGKPGSHSDDLHVPSAATSTSSIKLLFLVSPTATSLITDFKISFQTHVSFENLKTPFALITCISSQCLWTANDAPARDSSLPIG